MKEKRSRIAPILHRIHDRFNASISEIDHQDTLQHTGITCALVSNDRVHIERSLQEILKYIESHWPDETIYQEEIEII